MFGTIVAAWSSFGSISFGPDVIKSVRELRAFKAVFNGAEMSLHGAGREDTSRRKHACPGVILVAEHLPQNTCYSLQNTYFLPQNTCCRKALACGQQPRRTSTAMR